MDTRDDDDEEEDEVSPPKSSPKRGKGKAKAAPEPVEEEDDDMEDDIARGMDDVDMAPPDSDEEPAQPQSPPKKTRPAAKEKPKPPASKSQRQKENREGEWHRFALVLFPDCTHVNSPRWRPALQTRPVRAPRVVAQRKGRVRWAGPERWTDSRPAHQSDYSYPEGACSATRKEGTRAQALDPCSQ
jgi:hypothetical protein